MFNRTIEIFKWGPNVKNINGKKGGNNVETRVRGYKLFKLFLMCQPHKK